MLNPHDRSVGSPGTRRAFWAACLIVLGALSGCGGSKISVNIASGGGYEIDLTGTAVDDKDLESLKNIVNLKGIDLQGTQISDAGLDHLCAIESLKSISLGRSNVTREGVARLKKTRPNWHVEY
jgi:hypothetical protein